MATTETLEIAATVAADACTIEVLVRRALSGNHALEALHQARVKAWTIVGYASGLAREHPNLEAQAKRVVAELAIAAGELADGSYPRAPGIHDAGALEQAGRRAAMIAESVTVKCLALGLQPKAEREAYRLLLSLPGYSRAKLQDTTGKSRAEIEAVLHPKAAPAPRPPAPSAKQLQAEVDRLHARLDALERASGIR